jgi:hypothetical protein
VAGALGALRGRWGLAGEAGWGAGRLRWGLVDEGAVDGWLLRGGGDTFSFSARGDFEFEMSWSVGSERRFAGRAGYEAHDGGWGVPCCSGTEESLAEDFLDAFNRRADCSSLDRT